MRQERYLLMFFFLFFNKYPTQKKQKTKKQTHEATPTVETEQLAKVLIRVGWEPKRVAQMLPESLTLSFKEYSEFMTSHVSQVCYYLWNYNYFYLNLPD